ncbi:MAG: hypothetical protein KDG55_09175 [Rhodocyclaceae bacterium]|nr:hypothetical protein [Rhodocyclaceae bacterium]
MTATALDRRGMDVSEGDRVRILGITPDPDMDEDELEMVRFMIGSECEVDRIDATGLVWVSMWWSCGDGTATSCVGLESSQFERL